MSVRSLRVGVVGARRVRDGTGAFLARLLRAAGNRITAVAGTSDASAAAAADALGDHPTPYGDPRRMIEREPLDVLVIASPAATHADLLDAALARGLHVLCEKPLVHAGQDDVARGTALVAGFAAAGRCLTVNAQWRHALGTYMRLCPEVTPRRAARFEMDLSPSVGGVAAVAVAMPHPLSVLDHLFPAATPGLADLVVAGPPEALELSFVHPGRGVACTVRLTATEARPRPLGFAFDGVAVRRTVEEPGYRMALATADGARSLPLPDPVEAVVKDFVGRVRRGPPFPPEGFVVPGLHHLRQVEDAVARHLGRGGFAAARAPG